MKIDALSNIKSINGQVFRFADVVESIDGHRVLKFDNDELLSKLKIAAQNTATHNNESATPYVGRINEFGNYVQNLFASECRKLGLNYHTPTDCDGHCKESGYPDGCIEFPNGDICYIEVKTFAHTSGQSTLRSFFYSPSNTSKITKDAPHLLVGFATASENAKGPHTILDFHFTDMFLKNVKLKLEFNQDNKNLYKPSDLL